MKLYRFLPGLVTGALLGGGMTALAATRTYQHTGIVVANDGTHISVDKGGDVWDFTIDRGTKGSLDAKKGDKVTVNYRMFATRIEKK